MPRRLAAPRRDRAAIVAACPCESSPCAPGTAGRRSPGGAGRRPSASSTAARSCSTSTPTSAAARCRRPPPRRWPRPPTTARAERMPAGGLHRLERAPTSSRAWPPSTAGAGRPGPSPTAPASCPVDLRGDRPGRVRSGAAPRPGRPRRDDRGRLRLRERARRWWPSSPAWSSTPTSSAARPPTPASAARRRWWCPTATPPLAAVADLLSYLPANNDEEPPALAERRPDRPAHARAAGDLIPTSTTGSYDVRAVMRAIVDDGELLELRGRWAPNLVTAFATIDGRPVGILGNQPLALAGTLDIPARQKGARFVAFCDAFNLPIVTLVDTPGLLPGQGPRVAGHDPPRRPARVRLRPGHGAPRRRDPAQELRRRLHRHGLQADGQRPLPGLARRRAGRDGRRARRRPSCSAGRRPTSAPTFEADYHERLLNPYVAADRGYVDAVIDPAETRAEIARALTTLESTSASASSPASTTTPRC